MFKYLLLAFIPLAAQANTVLLIGDSHSVGPFGQRLDENLRQHGYVVATFASCGSIGRWWMTGQPTKCGYFSRNPEGKKFQTNQHPTPSLRELLQEIGPTDVILQFGTNYAGYAEDFVQKDIRNVVRMVRESGAHCFWIGPPDARTHRQLLPQLYRLIQVAIGDECPLFESHRVTRYPEVGGDGIHYWSRWGIPIANEWADLTFEAFKKR